MCNFYIMYWVDGDHLLKDNVCYTQGPPNWYFDRFKPRIGDIRLKEEDVPSTASDVPPAQVEELEMMEKSGGMHAMHGNKQQDHSKMDHSKMDHAQMAQETDGEEIKTNSKFTNEIVKLLRAYEERYRRMEEYERLERAQAAKRLMNEIDLN